MVMAIQTLMQIGLWPMVQTHAATAEVTRLKTELDATTKMAMATPTQASTGPSKMVLTHTSTIQLAGLKKSRHHPMVSQVVQRLSTALAA